jgi:CheY-like chemotaxis protein
VLVVEDNPVNQIIAREMVAALGLRPAVVGSGEEAMLSCQSTPPDLVLMDIQMPVMSGDAAIREILGVDPLAKILAVTAYRYSPEQLGVPVLNKGFGPSEFISAVESILHEPAA